MRPLLVTRLGLGLASLALPLSIHSVAGALTQPDGTVIPVINPSVTTCAQGGNVQLCLDDEEGGQTFDAQAAAAVLPETYTPTCSLTFRVLARGAGFHNTFGWYNVVPGSKPDDADLHAFLECSDGVGTPPKVLDIRSSQFYTGGDIGFFMATPQGAAAGGNCPTFNPNGGPIAETVGRIYYSERAYNPDNKGANSYIHLITYNSVTYKDSFYFAWEDLFDGGDNDFDDLLTRVSGIYCTGGGAVCDTGFDGRCSFGTAQCRNGAQECVQNEWPLDETCNGIDDDCNGVVDEGELCEESEVCHKGSCVPLCGSGEFNCPALLVCDQGVCVEPDCVGITCQEGQVCVDSECRGPCDGVQCPHAQVCRGGACVDPCEGVACDADYVCDVGVCVLRCTCGQCPDQTVCDETAERCVPDGCVGIACDPGQHCSAGGSCVDDCLGAVCPSGETCEQGACVLQGPGTGTGGTGGGGLGDGGLLDAGYDAETGGAGGGGPPGGFSGNYSGGQATGADTGGCGCRAGSAPSLSSAAWLLFAALMACRRRPRRSGAAGGR